MQPGTTITPGQQPYQAPGPSRQPASPAPSDLPAPQAAPAPPPAPTSQPQEAPEGSPTVPASQPDSDQIAWTASEYLIHQKTAGWYGTLGISALLLAGAVWLVTNDIISVVVVLVVAVFFGIAAARQPKVVEYRLGADGIKIGERNYAYGEFKSFSVIKEGSINSVMLMPLQRFAPGVSVYYPPEQEDAVLNTLAAYLPHEERQPDPIDRLMHKVRY